MRPQILIAEFLSTPWALMHERLTAFAGIVARWANGAEPTNDLRARIDEDRQAREARKSSGARAGASSRIAVLPLYGVICQRGNMVDDVSGPGSTSTQMFSQSLRAALVDDSIDGIMIDIDSPGGSVYGTQELADEIYQARGSKPIVAIANSLAASAAYWIGAQADNLYVTPSGEVGSIGVWSAHADYSAMLEKEGIKTTLIAAGKFKTEGNSYAPLDDEARAFMQSRVDDYYNAFVAAVAQGRGVAKKAVRDGMGQGRVLGPDAALAENMVDDVLTFDQALAKVSAKVKRAGKSALRNAADLQLTVRG